MLRILFPAQALIRKLALIAAAFCLLAAAAGPAKAQEWAVEKANTQITFEGTAGGQIISGMFRQYQMEVRFDPEEPGEADVAAAIDLNSVSTGNPELDRTLLGPEWFDTGTYPVASFRARSITRTDEGKFEMLGDLTIKGTTKRLSVPFTLDVKQGDAMARAEIVLSRADFKLGPAGPVTGMVVDDLVRIVITAAGKRLDN
jgi:polyisoprenoid-binding protein YceI